MIKHRLFICTLLTFTLCLLKGQDSLVFKGQLSVYSNLNPKNTLPGWSGARYIPQINYGYTFSENNQLDFEASANLYGNIGIRPFDSVNYSGDIKPYRIWARYSTDQFELRAGLQKINFGSASILRPLMWFDRIDPRDPLKLTDGVWGLLGRYYFLNNMNLWFWGLYGNKNPKGWEYFPTQKSIPEFGGRLQTPVFRGEAGLAYHHRMADVNTALYPSLTDSTIPENRFGFDAKFDMLVGWWIEASWSTFNKDIGPLRNQESINLGLDYTFGLGNGLSLVYEQLLVASDAKAFNFDNAITFSLVNLSYPIGMFDNISAIMYYDWTNNNTYNFLSWQRQFNKFSLYVMAYANPLDYYIPTQDIGENLYAGYGLQVMLVFNH